MLIIDLHVILYIIEFISLNKGALIGMALGIFLISMELCHLCFLWRSR